ncbi:MAG: hypothetical protein ACR2OL_09060 [Anderseniella sp.]
MSDNQALDTFDGLDYEEIEQAVMETSRGRWFLTEFARRHKAADTALLLDAIRRLEGQIQSMTAEQEHEPHATDSNQAASDYDEIADKLDRTTQLVRRLRSSHKQIGDAADKPLTAPKAAPAKSGSEKPAGDPPSFVGSDDDIFADNNSIVSALQQQAEMPDASPISNDTMQFAEIEVPDSATVDDAPDTGDGEASERPEQQAAPSPATSQSDEKSLNADETIKANGRISVTRPTAANQVQTDDEPAAEPEQPAQAPAAAGEASVVPEISEPEEKPKKRIVVIRRPADQPCDIPLADSTPELPDDSPTAA